MIFKKNDNFFVILGISGVISVIINFAKNVLHRSFLITKLLSGDIFALISFKLDKKLKGYNHLN